MLLLSSKTLINTIETKPQTAATYTAMIKQADKRAQLQEALKQYYPYWGAFLIWLAFWFPVIIGKMQFYIRDLTFYTFPMKSYMMERFSSGEFPFWTPRLSTGLPFFAEPSHQVFYPLNLIFTVAPSIVQGISWFSVLHYLGALWGMIALARTLKFSKGIALWIALVYGLSGYVIAVGDNVNYQPVITWGPLALACFIKGLQSSNFKRAFPWTALTSIILSLLLLAGDSFNLMFLAMFLSILTVWRFWQRDLLASGLGPGWGAVHCFLAFALVPLIGAVQVLPTWELLSLSVRQDPLGYQEVTLWSFPPERLIEFIVPFFYGSKFPQPHFVGMFLYPQFREPWVDSIFIGLIPIGLALLGLLRQPRNSLAWGMMIAMALFFGFGGNAFYYPLLLKLLPFLSSQRYLEKFIFWMMPAIAILAGYGVMALQNSLNWMLDWLADRPKTFHLGITVGVVLLSSFIFIIIPSQFWIWPHYFERSDGWGSHFYERAPHVLGLLTHWVIIVSCLLSIIWLQRNALQKYIRFILIVAVLDLCVAHYNYLGTVPSELLINRPKPVALSLLNKLNPPPNYRIYYDDAAELREDPYEARILERIAKAYKLEYLTDNYYYYWIYRVLYNQERLLFNYGIAYGVNYLNGRFAPLQLKAHKQFDVLLTKNYSDLLTQLSNVSYIITPITPHNPTWDILSYPEIARDAGLNLKIMKVSNTLPRAYLSPNPLWNKEPMEVYRIVTKPFFSQPLAQQVELSESLPTPESLATTYPTPQPPHSVVALQAASVNILTDRPEHITVSVDSPYTTPAYLVITESFFPGWKALIDQKQTTPIYLANQRFMAVEIPPGKHTVELIYTSTYFATGALISLISLLLLLGTSLFIVRSKP